MAFFFLTFPVGYIILAATLFNIPLNSCVGILLSPSYYIVALAAIVTGYGLWEMRRWSWYLFLLLQVLIGYENAVLVNTYSETHHKVSAFLISVLLQLILIFRIAREVRVPYFFPRISWWESHHRYRLQTPVIFSRRTGGSEKSTAEILDLSGLGCFIKLPQEMVQGEIIDLEFTLFETNFKCEGKVVWCAHSAVTHPKGIGVKFHIVSRHQKRSLRIIVKKLKKMLNQKHKNPLDVSHT